MTFVNFRKALSFPLAVFALLAIGSCFEPETPFVIPERCFSVAGAPEMSINSIMQEARDIWSADATFDGKWSFNLTNEKYMVLLHRGVSAITETELNTFTNDDLARELELRCTQPLDGGISDGRLWLFVKQPDGSDLHLGDEPSEIINGQVTFSVDVVDGCDLLHVELFCVMGTEPSDTYRIEGSFSSPYHFK